MTGSFPTFSYDTISMVGSVIEPAEASEAASLAELPVLVRLPEVPLQSEETAGPEEDHRAGEALATDPAATALEAEADEVRLWKRESWPDSVGRTAGISGTALALSLVVLLSLSYLLYVVLGRKGDRSAAKPPNVSAPAATADLDLSAGAAGAPSSREAVLQAPNEASEAARQVPQDSFLLHPKITDAAPAEEGTAPEPDPAGSTPTEDFRVAGPPDTPAAGPNAAASPSLPEKEDADAAVQGPQFSPPLRNPPPSDAAPKDSVPPDHASLAGSARDDAAASQPTQNPSALTPPLPQKQAQNSSDDRTPWNNMAAAGETARADREETPAADLPAADQASEPTIAPPVEPPFQAGTQTQIPTQNDLPAGAPSGPPIDAAVRPQTEAAAPTPVYPDTGAPSVRQMLSPNTQTGPQPESAAADGPVGGTIETSPLQPRYERIGSSFYQSVR